MFARFDENPAMTLRVIKETKRYGRTDGRTDNVKTVYPLQTKFAGGIMIKKDYIVLRARTVMQKSVLRLKVPMAGTKQYFFLFSINRA